MIMPELLCIRHCFSDVSPVIEIRISYFGLETFCALAIIFGFLAFAFLLTEDAGIYSAPCC